MLPVLTVRILRLCGPVKEWLDYFQGLHTTKRSSLASLPDCVRDLTIFHRLQEEKKAKLEGIQ